MTTLILTIPLLVALVIQRRELGVSISALRRIREFGSRHTGYGYSCYRMADDALKEIE